MENTMELWNSVCVTDPDITQHVNQRGGFTAICAQAQFKRATELWGPYGDKWGMSDISYGEIKDGKGDTVEITMLGSFFYPLGEVLASFVIGSDIKFRAGDDSRKKLLTDATTKALSKLGFNADVFEGKFDDNKYVAGLKEKNKPKAKNTPEKKDEQPASELDRKSSFMEMFQVKGKGEKVSIDDLRRFWKEIVDDMGKKTDFTHEAEPDAIGWGIMGDKLTSYSIKEIVSLLKKK